MNMHFAAVAVVLGNFAFACDGQEVEKLTAKSAEELFRKTASEVVSVPIYRSTFQHDSQQNQPDHSHIIQQLTRNSDTIQIDLLQSRNSKERGLALVIFSGSSYPNHVQRAIDLVDVEEKTFQLRAPSLQSIQRTLGIIRYYDHDMTLNQLARLLLSHRIMDDHHAFDKYEDENIFTGEVKIKQITKAEILNFWSKVPDHNHLPSEWVFRFKRAAAWNDPLEPLKQAVAELPPDVRVSVMAELRRQDYHECFRTSEWFAKDEPDDDDEAERRTGKLIFSDAEMDDALQALDPATRKAILLGEWKPKLVMPVWMKGPNAHGTVDLEYEVFRAAEMLFAPEDAAWILRVLNANHPKHAALADVAARIDPKVSVDVLKRALFLETDTEARVSLATQLYRAGPNRPDVIKTLLAAFYGEDPADLPAEIREKRDDLFEFQCDFLNAFQQLKISPRPLFRAIILDARFAKVGWSVCRVLAKPATMKIVVDQPIPVDESLRSRQPLVPIKKSAEPLIPTVYDRDHNRWAKAHPEPIAKLESALTRFRSELARAVGEAAKAKSEPRR